MTTQTTQPRMTDEARGPRTEAGRAHVRWFAETFQITEPGNNVYGEKVIADTISIEDEARAAVGLDVERLHRAANKALMGGQTRAVTDAIVAEYARDLSCTCATASDAENMPHADDCARLATPTPTPHR